jgi:hypothetical protein
MRLLPLALIFFLTAGVLSAQEPSLPKPETQDPAPPPSPAPNALVTPTPTPPQLIPVAPLPPDNSSPAPPLPNTPTIPQLDEVFKQTPVNTAAANARSHLAWRDLKNKMRADPEVKRALATAEAARTDLEKRKLLERYYEIYFGKMIAAAEAPEVKGYINDRKNEVISGLRQSRVRPTPTPQPSAARK